jgi:hypothetical protein
MKGCALLVIPCIDRCSCFHQYAADFRMPVLCSEVEGRALLVIPCIDRCSCFHQYAANLDLPL